jgi:hypothetical protein
MRVNYKNLEVAERFPWPVCKDAWFGSHIIYDL